MFWKKLAKIFDPLEQGLISHAQCPNALVTNDLLNVYFCSRTAEGKSLPYLAQFNKKKPTELVNFSPTPLLPLGETGCFDEHGVMPSSLVWVNDKVYMYYTGWNLRDKGMYHNSIGLAISHDAGLTFEKAYQGPVLDRNIFDPIMTITPEVKYLNGKFHMWYSSGLSWLNIDGKQEPVYSIKYAESDDGIAWKTNEELTIKQDFTAEAVTTPSIVQTKGNTQMWYCHRSSTDFRDGNGSYKIGYAESKSNGSWVRLDNNVEIEPSDTDWDSNMQCYPCVFELDNELYMLYNGNGFGKTGFGLMKKLVK